MSKNLNIAVAKLDNGNIGMNIGIGNSSGRNYELSPAEAQKLASELNWALEQMESETPQ